MNKKEQQAQRAKQEDEILAKVLWWIVGSVVLEALILLLNRYCVNYTASQIDLAYALQTQVLPVLAVVFPVCFVVMLVLWLVARKKGKLVRLTAGLTLAALALAVSAVVASLFAAPGIRFLYVAVPAVAVLALIYYLYQREFFCAAALSALGLLAVRVVPQHAGHPALSYGYAIVLAVALVGAAVVFTVMRASGGKLKLKGDWVQVLPKNANYALLYATCAVAAAVLAAALFLGALTLLYGVLVAWLLILAVYYTVRLM